MPEMMTQTDPPAELFERLLMQNTEPDFLTKIRKDAFARFQEIGFPAQSLEDWRFTNVKPIAEKVYTLPDEMADIPRGLLDETLHPEIRGPRLVFVNGGFREELSEVGSLPDGVCITTFRKARESHPELLENHLAKLTDNENEHFGVLNGALMQDGMVIALEPNAVLKNVIQVAFITTPSVEPTIASPRNLLVFGANSEAHIVETHRSTAGGVYFNNAVTEVYMGSNSHVDHYRVQRESREAFHVNTLRLYEERAAHFRSHNIDLGGALVRNNLNGKLAGEGCEATLNGLYMLDGKQHVDNYMWMEHMEENIPSHELYKGVLDGQSSAVFHGRIFVHRNAQKTDAKQTNQNLLLTDDARVNTKPQLEIYADDVKCTHGATIGQLDQNALFYLMSRAIDRRTARNLLIHAFAADITERIRIATVRERVENLLKERLLD